MSPALFVRRCCSALLCALGSLNAVAQPAREAPVPVERFFQHSAVLGAKLSPSGKYLAVSTAKGSKRVGLVVYEFGGGVTRIAEYADTDVSAFEWVSDERLVFSVIDLQDAGGEDLWAGPGLYAVDVKGKAIRPLILRAGRAYSWKPSTKGLLGSNHSLLHIPTQQPGVRPNEIIVGHHGRGDGDKLTTLKPMWLDTVTGETRKIELYGVPEGVGQWFFDSKGEPRLVVAQGKSKDREALYWLAPGSEKWQLLEEASLDKLSFQPNAVDDAGGLYVERNEGAEGYAVLTRFDFETMKPAAQPLVRVPGFDFSGELIFQGATGRALGLRVDADIEQTIWFDPAMKQFQAMVDEKFAGRVNRITCRRCGEPDMVALIRSYADRDPGALLLYEAAGEKWRLVSSVMDDIDPQRMARVAFQRIKARDGRDLPVWLTLPARRSNDPPPPVVVMVHGGPWSREGYWRWEPMEQFLASRGYLVISPEFRGSEGYGRAHLQAGWKQWGQAMQDDIADSLLWAQQRGLAAPGRACIAGASYGGYATLMGLARHPDLYRCGVAWAAITDLFLFLKGNWVVLDDVGDADRRYRLPEWVGDVEKDKDMLTANSPVAQAAKIKAPLLLAFGESDVRVPLAHGRRMKYELVMAGNVPDWVVYDNEGHGWRLVANQIDWAQRMERFLDQHLKP